MQSGLHEVALSSSNALPAPVRWLGRGSPASGGPAVRHPEVAARLPAAGRPRPRRNRVPAGRPGNRRDAALAGRPRARHDDRGDLSVPARPGPASARSTSSRPRPARSSPWRHKIIQPFEAGVIKAIIVRDGQSVKAGDVLIELDPTISAAERHPPAQRSVSPPSSTSRGCTPHWSTKRSAEELRSAQGRRCRRCSRCSAGCC